MVSALSSAHPWVDAPSILTECWTVFKVCAWNSGHQVGWAWCPPSTQKTGLVRYYRHLRVHNILCTCAEHLMVWGIALKSCEWPVLHLFPHIALPEKNLGQGHFMQPRSRSPRLLPRSRSLTRISAHTRCPLHSSDVGPPVDLVSSTWCWWIQWAVTSQTSGVFFLPSAVCLSLLLSR